MCQEGVLDRALHTSPSSVHSELVPKAKSLAYVCDLSVGYREDKEKKVLCLCQDRHPGSLLGTVEGLLLLPPATARGSRNLIKLLNPVPAETAHALHSSAWKTELVGLMALISWPAHTGFSFRSFLFCLETSAVHGSIS